jgi:hypothetical protein
MNRTSPAPFAKWIVCLVALSLPLSGCGAKERYLEQTMALIERNDQVDAKVAQLPKINAFKDPGYLRKLDGYITQKEMIRGQVLALEPPFLMKTTHNKLEIALNNGIRYLRSEREKFAIAAEKMRKTVPKAPRGREEYEIIKEYQSQTAAYQVDMKEQMMKKQYERLYWDVKDELERAAKF